MVEIGFRHLRYRPEDRHAGVIHQYVHSAIRPLGGIEEPLDHSTIHAVFEAQVDRAPDAVAILYGSTTWSYRQLNTRANFIAAALIAAGVRPEDTVAVMLDRSAS